MIAAVAKETSRVAFPDPGTLARRLGETAAFSPLRWRARQSGFRNGWDMLGLAVRRGCRHLAGIPPEAGPPDPGEAIINNEELVALLLHGRNNFEPFLIRAAAELLRVAPIDLDRMARVARRERCVRSLGYIARAGCEHDEAGVAFWRNLFEKLDRPSTVPPGVLPHWSRFVALHGVGRGGRVLGGRWIGAVP